MASSTIGIYLQPLGSSRGRGREGQRAQTTLCVAAGCGGHRPGLHCLHGSHHEDARVPALVSALLYHALLPGPLVHVWEHGGCDCTPSGPQSHA